LKQAEGTVSLRNGVARIKSVFSSDSFSMNPSGSIGLDETIDLAFDLKLSPHLTDKAMSSKVSKYIKDEGWWGTIPLKISGTFAEPSYTVDLEKAGKRVIKKEVDKYIDKLFDEEDQEEKKELEPLKDLLKGIFQ
jgi:AsmA protein